MNRTSIGKPQMQFYFADAPQFAAYDERYRTAHLIRSYRKHPERYDFRRHGRYHYSVRVHGSDAVAVLAA